MPQLDLKSAAAGASEINNKFLGKFGVRAKEIGIFFFGFNFWRHADLINEYWFNFSFLAYVEPVSLDQIQLDIADLKDKDSESKSKIIRPEPISTEKPNKEEIKLVSLLPTVD